MTKGFPQRLSGVKRALTTLTNSTFPPVNQDGFANRAAFLLGNILFPTSVIGTALLTLWQRRNYSAQTETVLCYEMNNCALSDGTELWDVTG